MRCPHCAGEIPDLSRFCGICGRYIDAVDAHVAGQAAGAPATPAGGRSAAVATATRTPRGAAAGGAPAGAGAAADSSLSLFELPVSRGARIARIALILALDAILIGAGVAMIISYLNARDHARGKVPEVASEPGVAEVEVLPPEPVMPSTTTTAETAAPGALEPSDREPAPPRRRSGARASRAETSSPPATPEPVVSPSPADAAPASAPATGGTGPAEPTDSAPDASPRAPADADGTGAGPAAPAKAVDAGAAARDGGGAPAEAEIELLGRKIAVVVEAHKLQLERCYRQAAKASTPSEPLQGRVVIQFGIMPDGRAQNARAVENTSGSERLATCVAAEVAGWEFPSHAAEGALEFRWPFVFKAPK